MIAGVISSAHCSVYTRTAEMRCNGPAEKQTIEPQSGVPRPTVPDIVSECVDCLVRVHLGSHPVRAEFIETQEMLGMGLPGQFRDVDDPDAFVWLRSFPSMEARASALQNFYTGSVWMMHGPAANATMINSDNVLLLKPTDCSASFPQSTSTRPATSAGEPRGRFVVATICSLAPSTDEKFSSYFECEARPLLEEAGIRSDAAFVTVPKAAAIMEEVMSRRLWGNPQHREKAFVT